MKKELGLIIILLTLFVSCNKIGKDEFRISGKITNGEEKKMYFMEMTSQGLKPLDTICIDNKGEFSFKYKLDQPSIYILMAKNNDYITLIPQRQEDIKIEGNFNSLSSSYAIKGSKDSELLHKLNQEYIKTNAILVELKQTLNDNRYSENISQIKEKLFEQYNILEISQKGIITKFIEENRGSLACIVALYRSFDNHYLFSLKSDLKVYEDVYKELNKKYPNNQHTLGLKTLIDKAKEKQKEDTINKSLTNK